MVFLLLCFNLLLPYQESRVVQFPAIEETELPTSLSDDLIYKIGDAILLPPELVLDESISLFNTVFGTPSTNNATSRIFNFSPQPPREHLFLTMFENAIIKEQRYFSNFDDTHFYIQDSKYESALDNEKMIDDHKRLLYDVFKDTYLLKYKLKVDNRVKDEAFNLIEWHDSDYVILPPLIAGYLYYRGLDKDFTIEDTYFKISLESFHKWSREENVVIGAGIEWAPHKSSPIKFIVAVGLEDGDVELQFIGIGTNLSTIKKVLNLQRPLEDVESYRR